jgi:nucleoside-diphosphate-sugar epimerase
MRVIVTGAAGLIGSAVAARLARDHDVIGVDLRPGPHVSIVGDCHDVAFPKGADAIVHVAALHAPDVGVRSDREFLRINVDATARLLDYGARHFVFTSTTSLFGHALHGWIDETIVPQPRDIYDETKLEAEKLVAEAGGAILRMSRCFPEPEELMTAYRLHRGIDRRDVAEAHCLALGRTGTWVISADTPFMREDSAQLALDAPSVIEKRWPGLTARMPFVPPSIDRVYDNSLARLELGFRPRFGIEACLAGDWDPEPAR